MKEPNLNEYICGMIKTSSGFGDLALIFKVTAELNRSNLSVCGDICFFSANYTRSSSFRHILKGLYVSTKYFYTF